MSRQHSDKQGVKSNAQKERSRHPYDAVPPVRPVAGAFSNYEKGDGPIPDSDLEPDETENPYRHRGTHGEYES